MHVRKLEEENEAAAKIPDDMAPCVARSSSALL